MTESRADWLPVAEAREAVLAGVPLLPSERLPLERCLGRVLAEAVRSPLDLPPWDNSGMDGFAVRAADVGGASAENPVELRVIDDVAAGGFARLAVAPGTAIRVMTGAPVPDGADSVIRVEHTDGGHGLGTPDAGVRVVADEDAGKNIRRRGEDLHAGAVVLREGEEIHPAAIGVAASVGSGSLTVRRRPRVAVVSSGDELVELEGFAEVMAGRKIVSSNGYALAALLADTGMEVRGLGIARDDPAALQERIEAARGCDALITSAGVSVGAHDHTRDVLDRLGARLAFWRVRMKPGSPFAFGWIGELGGIPWFGLPGNPVSAMVTFELFVRPALLRMAGHRRVHRPTVEVRLPQGYEVRPGLTHFVRVRLRDGDGMPEAALTGAQGSGILTSMAAADALLVVGEETSGIPPGGTARAIVLRGSPLREDPGY